MGGYYQGLPQSRIDEYEFLVIQKSARSTNTSSMEAYVLVRFSFERPSTHGLLRPLLHASHVVGLHLHQVPRLASLVLLNQVTQVAQLIGDTFSSQLAAHFPHTAYIHRLGFLHPVAPRHVCRAAPYGCSELVLEPEHDELLEGVCTCRRLVSTPPQALLLYRVLRSLCRCY